MDNVENEKWLELTACISADDAPGLSDRIQDCGHEIRDLNGRTLLHHAAESGATRCLSVLVSFGADLNAADVSGDTPLHRALSSGKEEAVSILLEAGADPNAANANQITPVLLAAAADRRFLVLVLAAGGDVDARDAFGLSVKEWSARAADQAARRPARPLG